MLIDTQIIQRHGKHAVLAQRQEILFHDGTAVHVHPVVNDEGERMVFLRALQLEGLRWYIVDLRTLVPKIEHDLLGAHDSDRWGIVFYTLRLAFDDAAALVNAVQLQAHANWWRDDVMAAA